MLEKSKMKEKTAALRHGHDTPHPQNTTIHLYLAVFCRLFYESQHYSVVPTIGLVVTLELQAKTEEIGSKRHGRDERSCHGDKIANRSRRLCCLHTMILVVNDTYVIFYWVSTTSIYFFVLHVRVLFINS